MNKIVCLIPAKGCSKRIPKKNIKKLNGKPLILYTIESAVESKIFDDVYIITEDEEIKNISKINKIKIHNRKKEPTIDSSTIEDVAINFINDIEKQYDILCVLLPTSPLRTSVDIKNAFDIFFKKNPNFLISITELETPSFKTLKEENGFLYPIFEKEFYKKRSELQKTYRNNGAIMISKIDALKKQKTLFGMPLVGYKMPQERSIDIDNPIDFLFAEKIIEEFS